MKAPNRWAAGAEVWDSQVNAPSCRGWAGWATVARLRPFSVLLGAGRDRPRNHSRPRHPLGALGISIAG
jgi:hypothetical protein